MIRYRNLSVLPIVVLVLALCRVLSACSDTGCLDNRSSIPLAGFYSYQTGQKLTVDSVEIGGVNAPNDSLLMKAGEKYSSIYLPFRFEFDNTSFYIRYVSKELNFPWLVDTISFRYTSEPYFASEDCGAMYRYHIEKMTYTTHLIDSVAVADSLITNIDTERIKIFFRTAEVDEDETGQDDEPAQGGGEEEPGDEDNPADDETGNAGGGES